MADRTGQVGPLPEPSRNARARTEHLFMLAYKAHVANPDLEERWVCVLDCELEYESSVPKEYTFEGAKSREYWDDRMKREKRKFQDAARRVDVVGYFAVARRRGRIYIRHEGEIPT